RQRLETQVIAERDSGEAAAAAASGPEEVGGVDGVDQQLLAVHGDGVDRIDAPAGCSPGSWVPSVAPREQVAAEADGWAVADREAEPVGDDRVGQFLMRDARLGPRQQALGLNLDPLEGAEVEQQRVVAQAGATPVVPPRLDRDPASVGGGLA